MSYNYADLREITENIYGMLLNSGCCNDYDDCFDYIDGFINLSESDARAAWARAACRAAGEHIANYWETPRSERFDYSNCDRYADWLRKALSF